MSDDTDDARIKRIGELLDALSDPTLAPDRVAALERELDQFVQVRDPDAVGVVLASPELFEFIAFVQRLIERQGTIMPDFAAIRKRKSKLDRKLFGRDQP